MSNTISDNLHRLIKSLTKPEKRYFKVFSSRHIIGDENNYEILFDAIDRQEEYDEDKLLKKFKDKAFVQRFSITKNRLYGAILKSLDSFHSNSSVEAQLHRQIHAAEILYNKSLYDQSLKLLHSARKTAQKHEMLTALVEISRWEKRIMEKDNYEHLSSSEELNEILEQDSQVVQALQLSNELWSLKSKLFFQLYREGKARSAEELQEFEGALNLLEPKASSTEHFYLIHHIRSAYHFGKSQYAECLVHLEKNIELIETNAERFDDEPTVYLSVLSNAIHVSMRVGTWERAFELLRRMRSFASVLATKGNEDIDMRTFHLLHSTELSLFTQSGEFEKALDYLPAIESAIKQHDEHISSVRRAYYYFNIAVIYFGLERYHDSLKWLNKLLNRVDIDKSKDIHCMAQILNLVVHLQLGNTDLLPYTMRSTQRFLETRNKVYQFENVMLDFVNELLKKRQSKSSRELHEELASKLEALKQDAFEKTVFEYFDFLAWARSKVSSKTYRELLAA
jgi:tetratricopeptide (TPR) repeat protein